MGLELGYYKHFKGTVYSVIAIATDTETGWDTAIYLDLNHPAKFWVRPVAMFFETVTNNEGVEVLRFEKIED
jgi:hypothetical protein